MHYKDVLANGSAKGNMSLVNLPEVDNRVSAKEALDLLIRARVGAVIAPAPGGHAVYTARILTKAIRSLGNDVAVARISGEETVAVPRDYPTSAPERVLSILESAGVDFGFLESIQSPKENRALVVTRFDVGVIDLNKSVVICTCPQNPNHVYLESDLNGNHVCEADGATLTCV